MIFRITNLETEKIGDELWRLTRPLIFGLPTLTITVPKNFITDGNSRPQIAGSFCNRMGGPEAEPSVLHDWLYSKDCVLDISRKEADQIFYDAMVDSGVSKILAHTIYSAVRIGGKSSFRVCNSIDYLRKLEQQKEKEEMKKKQKLKQAALKMKLKDEIEK